MKEKKTTTKAKSNEKVIRNGNENFDGVFLGTNKYGLYVGMKKDDDTEFINGYEAINLVNNLLNEFDKISVDFSEGVSEKGTHYEIAKVVDYKI